MRHCKRCARLWLVYRISVLVAMGTATLNGVLYLANCGYSYTLGIIGLVSICVMFATED